MTLVLCTQGETLMLKAILNQTLRFRLFTNNVVPAKGDVEGTYVEATFTGYAFKPVVFGDWTYSGGNPTVAAAPLQRWASTVAQANQSVYGYYVTQASDGKLVWAERFADGPYVIGPLDSSAEVFPAFSQG
jgi:hypothetical protein